MQLDQKNLSSNMSVDYLPVHCTLMHEFIQLWRNLFGAGGKSLKSSMLPAFGLCSER